MTARTERAYPARTSGPAHAVPMPSSSTETSRYGGRPSASSARPGSASGGDGRVDDDLVVGPGMPEVLVVHGEPAGRFEDTRGPASGERGQEGTDDAELGTRHAGEPSGAATTDPEPPGPE